MPLDQPADVIHRGIHTCVGRYVAAVALLAVCIFAVTPATAQNTGLDDQQFIEGLEKRGMNDLVLRLLEKDPPDDPAAAKYLEFVQFRQNSRSYGQQAAEARATAPEAAEEFEEKSKQEYDKALATLSELIESFYDHHSRPRWQTDLAQMQLDTYLTDFYTLGRVSYVFGVPNEEQREAFERVIPKALEAAADADAGFAKLRLLIPRRDDFVEVFDNTGLWETMIEDYWQTRTQFYLAEADYLTALLPDSHPYFADIATNRNQRIPGQRRTAKDERARLLADGAQRLQSKLLPTLGLSEAIKEAGNVLLGQIRLEQNDTAGAKRLFDQVINGDSNSIAHFKAMLAKAHLMHREGQADGALQQLTAAGGHPVVQSVPLYRVVVADAGHRILLADAENLTGDAKAKAIQDSYKPYLDLFADERLGATRKPLEGWVKRRWAEQFKDVEDLDTLPLIVRMGIGEIMFLDGHNDFVFSQRANNRTAMSKAVEKLDRSMIVNRTLIGEGVEP
ncbi:MAG: hypothetical protein MI741_00170, partial [Rhodospirillales bacterium]|nr:hypothetical protein [Rhodospirillales bacterium]